MPQTFYIFSFDGSGVGGSGIGSGTRVNAIRSVSREGGGSGGEDAQCPSILPQLEPLAKLLYIDGKLICPPVNPLPNSNQLHKMENQKIYSDWISKTREYLNSLSFQQKKSLYLYQSSNYLRINDCVRRNNPAFFQHPQYDHITDTLDLGDEEEIKAIVGALLHIVHSAPKPQGPLYAYRGSTSRLGKGSFTSNQFLSFSMNPMGAIQFNQDGDYVYRVELGPHVPHLLSIAAWSDRELESEVIFPPGSKFEYDYTIPETELPFDPSEFDENKIYSAIVCLKISI